MISIRKWIDNFRGSGEAAVTVPSMDGALKPNNLLNGAPVMWDGGDKPVGNLASDGRHVFFSRGAELFVLDPNSEPQHIRDCGGPISAIAAHESGKLAVGVAGKAILLCTANGEFKELLSSQLPRNCPAAIAFESDDTLVVANGSASNGPDKWCRDLMEKNRSGSVWRVDLRNGEAKCIAGDLGFPAGVVVTETGDIVISESWRHQLLRLTAGGNATVVLDDLPGYPGAIFRSGQGGYWLSIFAPRRQLIEFVLREDGYRKAMLESLDEQYWVAPSLRTGVNYFEPVQSGGVRHLGIVKPWAPTRSYGLLVRLDENFNPNASYHSRADANRHGITSAVEHAGNVVVSCAATNQLLALDPTITED
ncbi:strictosidine synthase [Rhizobium rhizogenes]|uniref:strictosidine synthase n=1 Tax=Rhizobium rhizogenes TaxID=359 RepID=UPI001572A5E1|nr:strictosidine synthase [Rhizobium rhizogenes]NTF59617.1 strictosidine synthase [Rhizobium rhizogenes]NTF65912.1 strictosidine synthase [Rhizobium rhizogenes]NTF79177.1 strictosidine synthase [Rhizobium rhizogenes]NTF96026.1 strictosidine synthase [Rhizobium rhizogenes]NTG04829.1 strictosidine synthase [Rhizobium rhizogenes]